MSRPALIPLDLAKHHLRMGDDASQDVLIQMKLDDAVEIVSDMCNRDLYNDYCTETLPGALRQAILMTMSAMFEHEGEDIVGRSVAQQSLTVQRLILAYRIPPYEAKS